MRTITIEGLRVLAQVGVLVHEFGAPQPVLISVSVEMPDAPSVPERDDVSQVLDYRKPQVFADCDRVSVEVHVQHSKQDRP